LLDGFRRGDRDALQTVAKSYIQDVARTIRTGVVVVVDGQRVRLGQNLPEFEVEGLVQETFLRAFQPDARDRYDGVRPFGAWLATIARNLLIDRGRKESVRRKQTFATDDVEWAPSDEESAQDTVEARELHRLLQEFRSSLDEDGQTLFRIRYEEGISIRDAARRLNASEVSIRRRDGRMRHALFLFLKQNGYLEHATVHIGQSLL